MSPRFSLFRHPSPPLSERQELIGSLHRTQTLINQAYLSFNSACDHDLIDSYVFEINALQSRYNYLLRRVKALGEAE